MTKVEQSPQSAEETLEGAGRQGNADPRNQFNNKPSLRQANWSTIDWAALNEEAYTFGAAAAIYAAAGIPVFPVKLDKKPYTLHGFLDATTDQLQIALWAKRYPQAGVAIPTGEASNVFVVDVDPRHGGDYDKLAARFNLSDTLISETGGGGNHLLFAHPGFPVSNDQKGRVLGEGYDIRGDGGYIVAPNSLHPSGGRYQWLTRYAPVSAPDELLVLIRPDERPHPPRPAKSPRVLRDSDRREAGRYWLERYLPDARERNRNSTGFLLALQLRDEELSQGEARSFMLDYAANVPGDDYPEEEALATLRSVYSHPARARATSQIHSQPHQQTRTRTSNEGGQAGSTDTTEDDGGSARPRIIVGGRQLRDPTNEALCALELANTPEVLFRRNRALARVRPDEHGRHVIEEVTGETLRARLTDIADFGRWMKNQKPTSDLDAYIVKDVTPPNDLVSNILAQPDWSFPALISVTEAPVLRPDGSIFATPGYDATTKLYYAPDAGLKLPPIPEHPTVSDVKRAKALLDDVLDDFPYDSPTSRAHAYALLLTAVVRPAIAGMAPLALLTAPVAGTGKTLLASLVPAIASGRDPAMMSAPDKEEEWGKLITSALLAGPSFVLIDNISGTLQSAALEMLLTSPVWEHRMLGFNRMVSLLQRAVWVATGNNIQLGGDLPRRCYRIRLDAKVARPERREGFKHPDVVRYARKRRGELLAALLTLARSWYADGCPSYPVTPMGSYEDWARIIGSILAHAGIEGFLGNLDEMYAEADSERPQWAAFFTAWHATYASNRVTTNAVAHDASGSQHPLHDALPETLAPYIVNVGSLTKRLGYDLRKQSDVRYDIGNGREVYLKRAGENRDHAAMWQVILTNYHPHPSDQKFSDASQQVRVIAGDVHNSRAKNQGENLSAKEREKIEGSVDYHPQSPAPVTESQNYSGVTGAGDPYLHCPLCGGHDLHDYGDGLRCKVDDVLAVELGAAL